METLRELLATIVFITAIVLVCSIIGDFYWVNLFACLSCFIIAYVIWPSKKRGHREQANSFLDLLELLIELPVEMTIWIFRLLGRIFRSKDNGFDIDL